MGVRRYCRGSSPSRWYREARERTGEPWKISIHNLFEGSNKLFVGSRSCNGRWKYRKCRLRRGLGCLKLLVGRFGGRRFGLFRPSSIRSISREFSSFKKITNLIFYVAAWAVLRLRDLDDFDNLIYPLPGSNRKVGSLGSYRLVSSKRTSLTRITFFECGTQTRKIFVESYPTR
jgi:hypothetical protein